MLTVVMGSIAALVQIKGDTLGVTRIPIVGAGAALPPMMETGNGQHPSRTG